MINVGARIHEVLDEWIGEIVGSEGADHASQSQH